MNEKFPIELIRSIIGIERLLSHNFKQETFPKYEVLKKENLYKLRLLLAGYKQENIEIYVENDTLSIIHDKKENEDLNANDGFEHTSEKTISTRSFKFKIGIYNLEIQSASFTNGILEILLEDKQIEERKIISII
jgi:HSP20 family molecular chaperone IbpA